MRVLYDYQAFDMQCVGGVSRCFVENYKHLPDYVHAEFALLESDNVYMQQLGYPPVGDMRRHFITAKEFRGKGRMFRMYNRMRGTYYGYRENQVYSIRRIESGEYDVFHPTFFDPYFLDHIGHKPFVFTIHDMITELYPQYYAKDDAQTIGKRLIAPKASKIIAVSEHTKADVVRILGISDDKIEVIYHGSDESAVCFSTSPFSFPYILYVGDRGGYKDFWLMAKYMLPVLQRFPQYHVVCTGHAFTSEEYQWLVEHHVQDRFVNIIFRTNEEMMNLYHHAVVFVYSSEYEGFGIPILEAYKAQCPVLLNHASCFPEIAGRAAVYFHMDADSSDFDEQLTHVLFMSPAERSALIAAQNERLKRFLWRKSAARLAAVYESVV